jgi:hypothetical protein
MRSRQVVVIVGGILVLLVGAAILPMKAGAFGWRDFLNSWSASHLLVTGGDPYSFDALNRLNAQVAPERGITEPAWNPPWLVVTLAPLGLLPYEYAVRVWLLINILTLACVPLFIWRWLAGRDARRPPAWLVLVGLAFAGSLVQIAIGQITIVILLGILFCLAGLRSGHDGWAGAALVLSLSKPHLIYLTLPLILIWAALHRRWRVWLGLIAATVLGLIIATLLSPVWLGSYLNALGSNDFFVKLNATLGGFAKAVWGTDALRYLAVLTLFLLPWLVRLSNRRGLLTGVNVALLISLPLAPYGWSFDQIMLLPAITQIVFWITRTAEARRRASYALCLIAIYALMLFMKLFGLGDFYFVCVPLALGGLYAALYRADLRGNPRAQPLTAYA